MLREVAVLPHWMAELPLNASGKLLALRQGCVIEDSLCCIYFMHVGIAALCTGEGIKLPRGSQIKILESSGVGNGNYPRILLQFGLKKLPHAGPS